VTSFATIQAIYQRTKADMRRACGHTARTYAEPDSTRPEYQAFLRKVSDEFHRRLKVTGIEVEGVS
jgi:hypothetical protein